MMNAQHHSLLGQLADPKRLKRAARESMRRGSGPGADAVTWRRYRANLDARIHALALSIRSGTWCPTDPRRTVIHTFTGKPLHLAIPTVEERIVHRAIRRILDPILERDAFSDFVSGFRPRRNRLTSVRQACRYLSENRNFVVDVDVTDAGTGVTTNSIIDLLHQWISDGAFLHIIRTALSALPQPIFPGGGLTPTLVTLMLTPLDKAVAHMKVVRFTDNYTVFCRTYAEAQDTLDTLIATGKAYGIQFTEKQTIHNDPNPEDLYLFGGA
jgi:RNA-directed DNA polymerase